MQLLNALIISTWGASSVLDLIYRMRSYLKLKRDAVMRWDFDVLGRERVCFAFGRNVNNVWPEGWLEVLKCDLKILWWSPLNRRVLFPSLCIWAMWLIYPQNTVEVIFFLGAQDSGNAALSEPRLHVVRKPKLGHRKRPHGEAKNRGSRYKLRARINHQFYEREHL